MIENHGFIYKSGTESDPSILYTYVDKPIISINEFRTPNTKTQIVNIDNIHIGEFKNFGYKRDEAYVISDFNIYFTDFLKSLQLYFIDLFNRIYTIYLWYIGQYNLTAPQNSLTTDSVLNTNLGTNTNTNWKNVIKRTNTGISNNVILTVTHQTNNSGNNKPSYSTVPAPMVSSDNNLKVTYLDLIKLGTITNFNIINNNSISSWNDLFTSINSHLVLIYNAITELLSKTQDKYSETMPN